MSGDKHSSLLDYLIKSVVYWPLALSNMPALAKSGAPLTEVQVWDRFKRASLLDENCDYRQKKFLRFAFAKFGLERSLKPGLEWQHQKRFDPRTSTCGADTFAENANIPNAIFPTWSQQKGESAILKLSTLANAKSLNICWILSSFIQNLNKSSRYFAKKFSVLHFWF